MNIDISVFDRVLDKDESLEWVGKAEPFKAVDEANKKSMNMRWLLCGALAVVLTAAYIIYVSMSGIAMQIVVPIVTICVPLFAAIRPILDSGTIKRKLIFAMTNKRAIVFVSETNYSSMNLDKIDEVKIIDKGNGIGHVVFGSVAMNIPEAKLRYLALAPKSDYVNDEKVIEGMVFYNVAEIKKIKSMLDKSTKVMESLSKCG
jgi:hypothetical protein